MTALTPVPAALEAPTEDLLGRAAELEVLWYVGPRMWYGPSGEPVSGRQVAEHLEAALDVLGQEGWEPGSFGLWEVLAGPVDLTSVSARVLELVICARSGAVAVEPRLWDRNPARTLGQVRALLLAGAAYARRHGTTAGWPA
ncbi:hypothetical protein [Streptomyces sp. MN13]